MVDAISPPRLEQDDTLSNDVEDRPSSPLLPPSPSRSDTMSGLRVVNMSPHTESRLALDKELASDIPTRPDNPTASTREPEYQRAMSSLASPTPGSVFDVAEEHRDDGQTENTTSWGEGDHSGISPGSDDSYNLKPPPPTHAHLHHSNLESLSERFFSSEHLDTILRDYSLAQRFTKFLQTYRPQYSETLRQYVEARKAIVAVEYARAVAQRMTPPAGESPLLAANLDSRFELHARRTVKELVEEALPAYLTHRLVSLVTDTLVKEITGNSAPIMHELIPSLAEVYCISDPSVPDNPIVYASEEFYNTTRYSKQHAIGRNCRFLQGPKTSAAAVRRLIECLSKGEEVTETLLNYRRDGTPFMNLLMIAPLYDNKGTIRYFLGAQIDVSSLIEGGRGLESFAQLLSEERRGSRTAGFGIHEGNQRDPPVVLGDLGQLLTDDESEAVKNRAPRSDSHHAPLTMHAPGRASQLSRSNTRGSRIVLGVDEAPERPLWPDAELGRNGRLPGVYQNYLLVRPYPSLRITFTSPSLRIPGLLQTKLLDRIGGPASVREALQDALTRGGGVTAKVTWLTSSSGADVESGKIRWLHCTPMLGSDERVGVWMVVVCDDEKISGSLRRDTSWGGFAAPEGAQRFSTSKLYADYLKREGRASRPPSGHTQATSSTQARREAEDQFRDF